MFNKFRVKNYDEYIRRLKQAFADMERMPSNVEIEAFISKYKLDLDWKIDVSDVRQDIITEIVNTGAEKTFFR